MDINAYLDNLKNFVSVQYASRELPNEKRVRLHIFGLEGILFYQVTINGQQEVLTKNPREAIATYLERPFFKDIDSENSPHAPYKSGSIVRLKNDTTVYSIRSPIGNHRS
jgi:hypothetical protein